MLRALDHSFSYVAPSKEAAHYLAEILAGYPVILEPNAGETIALRQRESGLWSGNFDDSPTAENGSSFPVLIDAMLRYLNLRALESKIADLRVHAGGLVASGLRAAILVGASGAGKTTTTLECLRQGAAYLTDETVAYAYETHTVVGNRKPLTIKVSGQARQAELDPRLRGYESWLTEGGSWHVPPAWFGGTLADGPATPTVLAFPDRVDGALGTTVTTLHPAEAALLVGQQTSYLSSTPNALAALKQLTENTRCVRITAASSAHIADAVMDLLR